MGHLMRTGEIYSLVPHLAWFDMRVTDTFYTFSQLSPLEIVPAKLRAPFASGGLGLRQLAPLSPAANFASLLLCLPILTQVFPDMAAYIEKVKSNPSDLTWPALSDLEEAQQRSFLLAETLEDRGLPLMATMVRSWQALHTLGCRETIPAHPIDILKGFYARKAAAADSERKGFKIQHFISQEIGRIVGNDLLKSNPDPAVVARTLSNQDSGATAWLRVVPTKSSLRLSPSEFRQGVRMFCGLSPAGLPPGARCKCGEQLVLSHILSCKSLKGRTARHDAVVEDTFQWLRKRRIFVRKEVVGLVPGTANRVDLVVRADGVTYWCDVTIGDPGGPSYLPSAASKMGFVAGRLEGSKISKWSALAPKGVVIQPLALESTGLVGTAMRGFLQAMQKLSSSGPRRALLLSQLSVTCIRGGVEMVQQAAGHGGEAE